MVIDRFAAATADYAKQIDATNQATSGATKSSGSAQTKQTTEDTTTFTSASSDVQTLTKAAFETTPTRQAKVEALKQAVKSAQYELDSAKIAQSIANSI